MTSAIQMSMMNSNLVGTLFEPVFGKRMPSYSENMAPARLSQPQCVPGFVGKQFDGAYFSYKAQGKDITAFPPPWNSTESSVVDRRSPVTHLSGIDRLHIYRKDSSSEETHPGHNSPTKQGFTLYTKSPGLTSPQSTASVIVRNEQAAGDHVSTDRPVYLTMPQAVYRHSPCCTDLCCVMGRGSPGLSNQVYEHNWRTGEPGDTLLHQRRLHTEGVSLCSPGQTRTMPAVQDQTFSPTKLKEMSHSLQCSPLAYPSLYPSQPTYEPVIYHNRSPISKYGQAPQHPAYYYSPVNVEVEKRTESKNIGSRQTHEIPVVLKHPIQPPGDHYMPPPTLPRIETMANPTLLQGFDYTGYFVPRLNLNSSPIHTHLKHPLVVHTDYKNTSSKHVHRPMATFPSIHKDKSTLHAEHSPPFGCLEQTSPATCSRKSAVSTSSTQPHSRYCPPKHGAHLSSPAERIPGALHPLVAPAHLGLNVRTNRHHAYHIQPYLRHPHLSPTNILSNKPNHQKILYCPPIPVQMKNAYDNPQPPYVHKGPLKRPMSTSSPIKIPDEDDDLYVVEMDPKRLRTEHDNADNKNKERSPPMPVINNVFSLAPYQTYLQLARLHGTLPQRPAHELTQTQLPNEDMMRQWTGVFRESVTEIALVKEVIKTKQLDECSKPADYCKDLSSDLTNVNITVKQERPESVQQQVHSDSIQPTAIQEKLMFKQESQHEPPNTCAAGSTAAQLDLSKERPYQEHAETKISKTEQEDDSREQNGCSELSECPEQLKIIKKELEEIDPLVEEHMLEIKKCEPDFDEGMDSKPGSECGQKLHPSTVTPVCSPPLVLSAPPHPDGKINFLNIPPQCLKLSTYNIILPETNLPRTVQISANKSPAQPPPPNLSALPSVPLQIPVRKHFFELHQSLVKLISKSVAASSEETLKSWLARMELNHVASGKSQKVSCLFGAEGREACLNEEMKSSLQQVVQRLNEYTTQEHCPFPFVVRTGAIFLPMLVVKEVLFPLVHGALIDQALQEHRVELRPTTLSEEKTLIQMHKQACSSRLRRLMSVKHLPDVYADVVNLLYYTFVCKQLGLEMDLDADFCPGPSSSSSPPPSSPSPQDDAEQLQTRSLLRRSRIKRSCRRLFLDCSSDDEQQSSSLTDSAPPHNQPQEDDGSNETDDLWMCPLATEADTSNMQHNFELRTFQENSKSCPGVVLKLRRTCNRKRMIYRPVVDSERFLLETKQPESESSQKLKTPDIVRWKRTSGPFLRSLRPQNAYSKRKLRSLLSMKYCPYLPNNRRRWAAQRARRVIKKADFPDLVGKRIRHLYEEDDKSEVWYTGEVLGVYKANPDPLKTVFEVRYDTEPEWKYYLELLIDYRKGWLKIEE